MKRLTTRLGIALVGGMGLTLALLWLMSSPRNAELPVAYAAELHVCLSGCPYTSIQDAVDAASDGDVIKVAAGTYTGVNVRPRNDITTTGVVTQMVYVSNTVTIQGGYTTTNWTTSDPTANATTLDAESQGRVLYITGDISPTLEGLRLTGGDTGGGVYVISATATFVDNIVTANMGRGLYLDHSTATLSGNTVTANSGGGLSLVYSPATLSGNTVTSNTAYYAGGGLFLSYSPATLSGNIIATNTGGSGGGLFLILSPATLSWNTITSNTADSNGGGLHLNRSPATLNGNIVTSNTAYYAGGGLYLTYRSNATLSGNTVTANIADDYGGGLVLSFGSSAIMVNNLVADNQANSLASGLYIENSSLRLIHTTIARNRGGDGSGVCVCFSASAAMTNTILISQTVGITVTAGGQATLEGTLWGSGAWANGANWGGDGTIVTGTVNVFGDPGFVDPATGDYHIGPNSAAIDAGVNTGVMMDIDNQPRPYQTPDLGADEYWPPGALKYVYLPLVLKH